MRDRTVLTARHMLMALLSVMALVIVCVVPSLADVPHDENIAGISSAFAERNRQDTLTVPQEDLTDKLNGRRISPALLSYSPEAAELEDISHRTRSGISQVSDNLVAIDSSADSSVLLCSQRKDASCISDISASLFVKATHKRE